VTDIWGIRFVDGGRESGRDSCLVEGEFIDDLSLPAAGVQGEEPIYPG